MSDRTKIEWTDASWNPVTGCTKISEGCKHCYAEIMARRLQAMKNPRYANGFQITLHPDLIETPLFWKKPRVIFVNSMSDLFHDKVPQSFIEDVFETMGRAKWHTFQVLTKRSSRLYKMAPKLTWHRNIWIGVSVENMERQYRIDDLRAIPAAVRFLSFEPLLENLESIDLTGVSWVIVGGESGPCARPLRSVWVRNIRDQCMSKNTPFFFKQWGGRKKKLAGRVLDGRTWDELPTDSVLTSL